MEEIIVKEENNIRIDIYLANKKEVSRETIKRWIEEKNVLVNGQSTKPSYKVQENDKISVKPEQVKEISLEAQDIPIEVLYEDNDILVVNKPKGMVVHPANGNPDGTLVNAVMNI